MFNHRAKFAIGLFLLLTFSDVPARADFTGIGDWQVNPFFGGGTNGTGLANFGDVTANTGFATVFAMQGPATQQNPQISSGGVNFERQFTLSSSTLVELDATLTGFTAINRQGGGIAGATYSASATIFNSTSPFDTGITTTFSGRQTSNDGNLGDFSTTQVSSALLGPGTYLVSAKVNTQATSNGGNTATADFYNGGNGFSVTVVPEPSSFLMLTIGAVGLALLRRRGSQRVRVVGEE